MFGLGMSELIVILLILLLLFGASRLPGIAAGLGGAVHTFRKSIKPDDDGKSLDAASEESVKEASANKEKTPA